MVEAMADNAHGFDVKEIIPKIGFHKKKMEVTWNLRKSASIVQIVVHSLRGTFFPVVLLCQFLVLAGNWFWCYILMYLEYNAVVVLC